MTKLFQIALLSLVPFFASKYVTNGAPMNYNQDPAQGHNHDEVPNHQQQYEQNDYGNYHGHPPPMAWDHGQSTQFNSDDLSNQFAQGMQLGQASGAQQTPGHLPPQRLPRLEPPRRGRGSHIDASLHVVTFRDRKVQSEADLMSRPKNLRKHGWQISYSQAEIARIYDNITKIWGNHNIPTFNYYYRKLDGYLQRHPDDIDHILSPYSDGRVVHKVVEETRPRWFIGNPNDPIIWTPQKYLEFTLGHDTRWTPPHWAPDFLDEKMLESLTLKLQHYWGMDKDQVIQRLYHTSKSDMTPFVINLLTNKKSIEKRAASELNDLISKSETESHASMSNVHGNDQSTEDE